MNLTELSLGNSISPSAGDRTGEVEPVVMAKVRPPSCKGIPRPRLHSALADLRGVGLATVTAPAGSGKTTLLAQIASPHEGPVAWYRPETSDYRERDLLRYLHAAFSRPIPSLGPVWSGVEEAAADLDKACNAPTLLIIDDLHTLRESPAERTLERLLGYAPSNLAVLTASRLPTGMNLSGFRVAGNLLEIGPDDLRFRAWEVEKLFHEYYRQPLKPEDLAELARRTEGWAAGLQLFHLATLGKPLEEPRRTLAALSGRSRLVKEYLARNVLDDLRAELRAFLLDTCVLGRLSGPICDSYLGRSGSGALLRELEERQIFTYALDEGGGFRYHEVFRSHLESTLLEEIGPDEGKRRYRRAGGLLESSGAFVEALRAYCLAEEWDALARLLGREGELLAQDPAASLELLPDGILRLDPWLLLATAHRHRAAGRWRAAVDHYHRAEGLFEDTTAREACRQDRQDLANWLEPSVFAPGGWSGLVRSAVHHVPFQPCLEQFGEPYRQLAGGLCALVGGQVRGAVAELSQVVQAADSSEALVAGARLGLAVAHLLAGDAGGGAEAERSCEEAERLGLPWLARMGRAALALTDRPDGLSEAVAARMACEREDDAWGSSLAALFEGMGALRAVESRPALLEGAAARFENLGAAALAAWCRSCLALSLARRGQPEAASAGEAAESAAWSTGNRGAAAYACLALSEARVSKSPAYKSRAAELFDLLGLAHPPVPAPPAGEPRTPSVEIHCFGGFRMLIEGRPVDLSGIKPRARALLRLLALNSDRAIHREVLTEALWPESDAELARRGLHVAVSSLRNALSRQVPGRDPVVVREGDAYRLIVAGGANVDVAEFDGSLKQGRRFRALGAIDRAMEAFARALELHNGDLLPEDGPMELVARERERCRTEAVNAAVMLAELLLERKSASEAVHACERGLQIERYRDELWRKLLAAHRQAGDRAAETVASRRYAEILEDLSTN